MNSTNRKRPPQSGEVESDGLKALIAELQSVKMLLMLQALAMGYKQKHLASVLGVSEATVSRMMPRGFSKELARIVEELARIVESRSLVAGEG
jgi:predicted XRE-type DNA-binding protein